MGFEFKFEFDRFLPVTGQTGPVSRNRAPAVRSGRSDKKTLPPLFLLQCSVRPLRHRRRHDAAAASGRSPAASPGRLRRAAALGRHPAAHGPAAPVRAAAAPAGPAPAADVGPGAAAAPPGRVLRGPARGRAGAGCGASRGAERGQDALDRGPAVLDR